MNPGWQNAFESITGDKNNDGMRLTFGYKAGLLLAIIAIGWLGSRAFFLQIILGGVSATWAEGNRIEVRRIAADRGVIKDGKGVILARNTLSKDGKTIREYPQKEELSHVTGYVGEVAAEELVNPGEDDGIMPGSIIGKMGVEKTADGILRGQEGEELVEVNANGELIRVIGRKEPVPGRAVKLSVEADLNKRIAEVLKEREAETGKEIKGSVVVTEVKTGRVLGLLSYPMFDANVFSGAEGEGKYKNVQEVLSDNDNKPIFNRAIAGVYPPGSIYKLVTATAGLSEGKINRETLIKDTGEIKVGDYRFGTWNFDQQGRVEGELNVVKGLARSNDIFFYRVGEMVGVEALRSWSKKLGLGSRTGIDLTGEAAGLIPDPLEKERSTGERWFLGNTYHMSIGQGDLLATPLQMNRVTAAAISSRWCKPTVIDGSDKTENGSCLELNISPENRELIYEGMREACQSGGTAFTFFDFAVPVACKTGTAQHGGADDEPHAWITVVIPRIREDGNYSRSDYENGIVLTVMLEAIGEGSQEAGPVATRIGGYLLERK